MKKKDNKSEQFWTKHLRESYGRKQTMPGVPEETWHNGFLTTMEDRVQAAVEAGTRRVKAEEMELKRFNRCLKTMTDSFLH